MTTKKQIEQFLANEPIAMAGVSRNPKKFGRYAFEELTKRGLRILPVNPGIDKINDTRCYATVEELPADVASIIIMTKKDQTAKVVEASIAKGIRNIWIQQSSDTPEALALAQGKEVNLISGQCILMHHEPKGMHKFHRNIKAFFGAMPK